MRAFTGVLAVLHATTADGRHLNEPHPDLTRPMPLPLRIPDEGTVGVITSVWRDGNLIRYSGHLDTGYAPSAAAAGLIGEQRLVGMLDVDMLRGDDNTPPPIIDQTSDDPRVLKLSVWGWRVAAATLLPPDLKAWPEVTLTLDDTSPEPAGEDKR